MREAVEGRIQRKRNRVGYTFLTPTLVMIFCVLFVPMVLSLILSFTDWNFIHGESINFVGLKNYADIFTNPYDIKSFKITLLFVALSLIFEIVLGLLISLIIYGTKIRTQVMRTLIIFPMMISEVVAALCFRYILNSDFGVVNYLLSLLGIVIPSWTSANNALFTIILIEVWQQTPFSMLIILAGLQGLSLEMLEAVEVDGASYLQKLYYVIIPSIKPQIMVALIFRTMFCLRVFTQPWVMTGGGPNDNTMVIGINIYKQAFRFFEMGKANALSWLLILLTLAIVCVYVALLDKSSFAD